MPTQQSSLAPRGAYLASTPAERRNRCSSASELVDAHVVVFPERAGRLQRPRIALPALGRAALEGQRAVAVHLVGQAEHVAFPLAGLLQQVRPRHLCVAARVEADAAKPFADRFIHVGQQATY